MTEPGMVRLEEGVVELKPIAGTRRRGASEQEDRRLAEYALKVMALSKGIEETVARYREAAAG